MTTGGLRENPLRILGIDPGLANTGYGIIEFDGNSSRRIASGCIATESGGDHGARLLAIFSQMQHVLETHKPGVVAIEKLFFGVNARTAMTVGEGRGSALVAVAQAGLAVLEYSPAQIKQAVTGTGRANKSQVQRMVRVLLALEAVSATDHESDALAVAICHAHSLHLTRSVEASGGAGIKALLGMRRGRRRR